MSDPPAPGLGQGIGALWARGWFWVDLCHSGGSLNNWSLLKFKWFSAISARIKFNTIRQFSNIVHRHSLPVLWSFPVSLTDNILGDTHRE